MCAHVYQDNLHDSSPIGCLTKMTPIYVFPVFTKHNTQMFRSGCTNTRRQVAREKKVLTKTLNVFEFSACYLLHITALTPKIFR